jgi:rubrerythrin
MEGRMNRQQHHILELLANMEKSVGDLYRVFAAQFPEEEEFWLEVAAEEDQHERWVLSVITGTEEGNIKLRKQKIDPAQIEKVIADIQETGRKASAGHMTLFEALKVAHDLEDMLLERRIFEILASVYKGDTSGIMQDLAEATKVHAIRIKVKTDELYG